MAKDKRVRNRLTLVSATILKPDHSFELNVADRRGRTFRLSMAQGHLVSLVHYMNYTWDRINRRLYGSLDVSNISSVRFFYIVSEDHLVLEVLFRKGGCLYLRLPREAAKELSAKLLSVGERVLLEERCRRPRCGA
jgi:hypothetical protein